MAQASTLLEAIRTGSCMKPGELPLCHNRHYHTLHYPHTSDVRGCRVRHCVVCRASYLPFSHTIASRVMRHVDHQNYTSQAHILYSYPMHTHAKSNEQTKWCRPLRRQASRAAARRSRTLDRTTHNALASCAPPHIPCIAARRASQHGTHALRRIHACA